MDEFAFAYVETYHIILLIYTWLANLGDVVLNHIAREILYI